MLHQMPMPGDAVRLIGRYTGVKFGSIAILDGAIGFAEDSYMAVFAASAFRDARVVSCSGGPAPYVACDELQPTGEMITQLFWRWKDLPRANGGEQYLLEVPLWDWTPERHRARVDKALDTSRYWDSEGMSNIREAVQARQFLDAL